MNYKAASFMKATHLQRYDTIAIDQYERICLANINTLQPQMDMWSIQDYEKYYEDTCTLLVKLAQKATKYKIQMLDLYRYSRL